MVGWFLDSFRMGVGHQKDQTLVRSLKLSAPFFILWEVDRSWRLKLIIIDHPYNEASATEEETFLYLPKVLSVGPIIKSA